MVPVPRRRRRAAVQGTAKASASTSVALEAVVDPLLRLPPPPLLRHRSVLTSLHRHPVRRMRAESPELDSGGSPPDYFGDRTYTPKANDVILDRYCVLGLLGRGSFGTVVRAKDRITNANVAVKLLHRDTDLNADPDRERRTYQKLLAGCRPQIELFAAVLDSGGHGGHACIVFDLCQSTLYDIAQGFCGLTPLPGRQVMEISYQILSGVAYLHSLGIIHADLKPDNIAVRSANTVTIRWLDTITGFHDKKILASSQICILDLGSAVEFCKEPEALFHRIGNRSYRAPEISMGLPWGFAADTFAIGCIIAELYLSAHLFPSSLSSDREHVAMVDKLLGPFDEAYARSVEEKRPGTFSLGNPVSVIFPPPDVTFAADEHVEPMKRLQETRLLSGQIHNSTFHHLLQRLMAPNPSDRLCVGDAVKHKYFDTLAQLQWQ